jgi:hypothetical protein
MPETKFEALIDGLNIPTHLRVCYLLTFQWGFTPEELAIIFGISRSNVNFYLAELYLLLKLKLKPQDFAHFLS